MRKARIISIKGAGAIVRMENEEEAWLPGHELSLKYNPFKSLQEQHLCTIGDELDVIEYSKELGGIRKFVSHIRVHDDPWEKVKQWTSRDVKEMRINSVTPTRAFGIIEAGIQGYVELKEIYENKNCPFPRSWSEFKILSPGDFIAGYVDTSKIDYEKRLVKIDVIPYVKNLQGISPLLPINTLDFGIPSSEIIPQKHKSWESKSRNFPSINHALVVDDNAGFTEELSIYLIESGLRTTKAINLNQAESILSKPDFPDIDIAFIDVHLSGNLESYEGFDVARKIKNDHPGCRIIFMTSDEMSLNQIPEPFKDLTASYILYKPIGVETLYNAIAIAFQNEPMELKDILQEKMETLPDSFKIDNIDRSIYTVIHELKSEISAESIILFKLHPTNFKVKIVELSGDIDENIDNHMHKFRYSPVKDVAVDREVIIEESISRTPRYQKHRWLHQAIGYESCIAYPVEVTDEWRFALFAFHSSARRFCDKDHYKVNAAAREIGYILEIKRLRQVWKEEMPFILAGKTYGSMAHDLKNALLSEFSICALYNIIEMKNQLGKEDINKIRNHLDTLLSDAKRSSGIVDTFRKMSMKLLGTDINVDLFDLIKEVAQRIEDSEAKPFNITVKVLPLKEDSLSKMSIKKASLEQVIYNLILNAVQQTRRFQFSREKGWVTIEFSRLDFIDGKKLQILIHDTGPGIHAHVFEKIFEEGYTTKENGCGMGLVICRDIIKQFEGSIRVLKSILWVGTSFEILIPISK